MKNKSIKKMMKDNRMMKSSNELSENNRNIRENSENAQNLKKKQKPSIKWLSLLKRQEKKWC